MKANYEIDFVGNSSSGDADAIAIRWKDTNENYHVCLYDCGTENQADEMIELLNKHYFNELDKKEIDAIIISHPDTDHINGIIKIMDTFEIKAMYFNIPWEYSDELVELSDNYNSADYLSSKLKKQYDKLFEIEEYAKELKVPIFNALQGDLICDELLVLYPTKEDYIKHLLNSEKTPVKAVMESYSNDDYIFELWDEDNLLEKPSTSEENESSVVIWGLNSLEDKKFILLGDSGVVGINDAIDYAGEEGIKSETRFYQVPHHGGRHNLDTDTMNRLVGNINVVESDVNKTAYISVGKDSDHPRQCIVNAFKRRGVKVYKTNGNIIHHHVGDMPERKGWVSLKELEFIDNYDE